MTAHRLEPNPCPFCGAVLDAASGVRSTHDGPTAGDITVCAYCATILVFDDALDLRLPTASESAGFASDPDLIRAVKAITARIAGNGLDYPTRFRR